MKEKKAWKTLATCSAVEGLKQINKIKKKVAEYYKEIGVTEIKEKYRKLAESEEDESKRDGLAKDMMNDIFDAALDANAEKTIEIVCYLAFLDPAEANTLTIDDAYEIITESMKSRAVMDFFSSAARSVQSVTGNS